MALTEITSVVTGARLPLLLLQAEQGTQGADPVAQSLPAFWWVYLLAGAGLIASWLVLRRRTSDIEWNSLESDLEWDEASQDSSLRAVHDFVKSFSDSSVQWYQERRRAKRVWGVGLRAAAILLTAFAGLVPILDDLLAVIPQMNSEWSTFALGLAALLVTLDHFGGFTSGWIRYMLAQQKIERLQHAFLMDWEALKSRTRGDHAKRAEEGLKAAGAFLLSVGKIVDDETQEWATEFRTALKEIDKARKAAEEEEHFGAVDVTVTNHEEVDSWSLEVDGEEVATSTSKRASVTAVAAGLRRIGARGEKGGKELRDEVSVRVVGGAVAEADLTLS